MNKYAPLSNSPLDQQWLALQPYLPHLMYNSKLADTFLRLREGTVVCSPLLHMLVVGSIW